jgi:hypothetical protein
MGPCSVRARSARIRRASNGRRPRESATTASFRPIHGPRRGMIRRMEYTATVTFDGDDLSDESDQVLIDVGPLHGGSTGRARWR